MDGWVLVMELRRLGIRVRTDQDKLLVSSHPDLTPDLKDAIARNKAYLLRILQEEAPFERKVVARFQVKWGSERGWIAICDPFTGQWVEIPSKGQPRWIYSYLPFKNKIRTPPGEGADDPV